MTNPRTQHMIDWAHAFAQRFLEEENSRGDIHDLIDWGYEIYPENRHREPGAVATARRQYEHLTRG